MAHSRTKIRIETSKEAMDFCAILNKDGTADKYTIENFDCSYVIDARSYLGVLYASAEMGELYLVNCTHDGAIPSEISIKFSI